MIQNKKKTLAHQESSTLTSWVQILLNRPKIKGEVLKRLVLLFQECSIKLRGHSLPLLEEI